MEQVYNYVKEHMSIVRWQFSDRDLLRMGSNLGEAFYKFSKCLQSKT